MRSIRLAVLVILFALGYLIVSRQFSVFTEDDFELLENAVPQVLVRYLDMLKRLLLTQPS